MQDNDHLRRRLTLADSHVREIYKEAAPTDLARHAMILSTHAVVGAALASLMPSHPVAEFAAGFASHYVIDGMPHWDYPLRSISVAPGAQNDKRLTPALLRDLTLIGIDAFAGLALAIAIFATPATLVAIFGGAVGAMLPDPLQFVYAHHPYEPVASLQRFHRWIHTKRRLGWQIGVSSQISFASVVTMAAVAVR